MMTDRYGLQCKISGKDLSCPYWYFRRRESLWVKDWISIGSTKGIGNDIIVRKISSMHVIIHPPTSDGFLFHCLSARGLFIGDDVFIKKDEKVIVPKKK